MVEDITGMSRSSLSGTILGRMYVRPPREAKRPVIWSAADIVVILEKRCECRGAAGVWSGGDEGMQVKLFWGKKGNLLTYICGIHDVSGRVVNALQLRIHLNELPHCAVCIKSDCGVDADANANAR